MRFGDYASVQEFHRLEAERDALRAEAGRLRKALETVLARYHAQREVHPENPRLYQEDIEVLLDETKV